MPNPPWSWSHLPSTPVRPVRLSSKTGKGLLKQIFIVRLIDKLWAASRPQGKPSRLYQNCGSVDQPRLCGRSQRHQPPRSPSCVKMQESRHHEADFAARGVVINFTACYCRGRAREPTGQPTSTPQKWWCNLDFGALPPNSITCKDSTHGLAGDHHSFDLSTA